MFSKLTSPPRSPDCGNQVLRYLDYVFIGGLALDEGRDIRDGSVHLDGDHFDGNGHGASGQDGRVDDLGVLRREGRNIHETA